MSILYALFKVGYDKDGYDKEGLDRNGFDREGYSRDGFNIHGFDHDGYTLEGYDEYGYCREGFNQDGFDKDGFDRKGLNIQGFDREGRDESGFDKDGYDRHGFDRDGFDKSGYDKDGYNRQGVDNEGFNKSGYNKDGFDCQGFDCEGFNVNSIDKDGFDINGFHIETGYNRRGYDRGGYNAAGFDQFGYGQDGFNLKGFNSKGVDKEGYNTDGFHVKTGLNRKGFDRKGFDKSGFNHSGYDSKGYNRQGVNLLGFNRNGAYDKAFDTTGQVIYHEVFGEGIVVGLSPDSHHIFIKFSNGKDATFQYPDGIGEFLFTEKPIKIQLREEFLADKDNYEENEWERKHFEAVCAPIKKLEKQARDQEELEKYGRNDYSDSYDPCATQKYLKAAGERTFYTTLLREPFFARVDYKRESGLYIGKHEIKGEVIDWADPICKLYYEYQIYIGNQQYDLSLVRDFKIQAGEYYGFENKYVKGHESALSQGETSPVITDPRLLAIIRANRESKKVQDIIQTIQANQYKIVTCALSSNLLVQGCAGSGKTMILFHRLRYLLRNNKDLEARNVFLISPTEILNAESQNLSATLQIQNINKLSAIQFHKHIINRYYKSNHLAEEICDRLIVSNVGLPSAFVHMQYTKENINQMIISLRRILKSGSEENKQFKELERERLRAKISEYTGVAYASLNQTTDASHENNIVFSLCETYTKAVTELNNVSTKNLTAIMSDMKKSKDNKKFRISVLEFLLSSGAAKGLTKFTGKDQGEKLPENVYRDEACLTSVFTLFEKTRWRGGKKGVGDSLLGDANPLDFYQQYAKIINQVQSFLTFELSDGIAYLFYIAQGIIEDEKKRQGISQVNTYEYELFLHLCLCFGRFGKLLDQRNLIFIDEVQDFSHTELAMYQKVFPNAIFNYYGDFNQCISEKGTHSKKELEHVDCAWADYEISENYRNAYEITQYINNKFHMQMMPIGQKGIVDVVDFSPTLFSAMPSEPDDRIACIIKDANPVTAAFEKNELVHIITDFNSELVRGRVNVFPVSLTKGLEFERVYVFPRGMSPNEEYVAYTRALKELYIIK